MEVCDIKNSAKFANMGFVCACLVVLDHVMLDGKEGATWLVCQIFGHEGVVRIAVPFFFFASGYWLSRHFTDGGQTIAIVWWREMAKRTRTLLIPYLFFNALYWFYLVLVHGFASKLGYAAHISSPPPFNLHGVVDGFLYNPILRPSWFVRTLLMYVIFSPVFVFVSMRISVPFCLLALSWLGAGTFMSSDFYRQHYDIMKFFISIEGLVFFLAGMMVRFRFVASKCWFLILKFAFPAGVALFVARVIAVHYGAHGLGFWFGWAGVPVLIVGVWSIVPDSVWPRRVVSLSFPIYLIHQFVLVGLAGVVGALGFRDFVSQSVCLYFIRWGLVMTVCIILAMYVKRMFPRFSNMVFGGR